MTSPGRHETVVVGVDGTAGGAAAVRYAATQAAARGARLHAVHVMDRAGRHDAPLESDPALGLDHARRTVPSRVAEWVGQAGADVEVAVSIVVGDVVERLAHEAVDATLVVVGAPDGERHHELPAALRSVCLCPVTVVDPDGGVVPTSAPPPSKEPTMYVRDVMSSPAVTVTPGDALAEVAKVLDRRSLTSLPVVDDDHQLVGVIGEADVIGQLTTFPSDGAPEPRHVRDVMTRDVRTVNADDTVHEVVALMRGTTLKSLPVLLHGRVVGMISRRDVVRAMARGELDAHPVSQTAH